MVNLTDIYFRNAEALTQGNQLVINQGGQGSSKTYSILQNIYDICKHSKKPLVASVTSYALPHLKIGAIRDLKTILADYGEPVDEIHNKSDGYFKIGKSIIEYFGIQDNYAKVHGPRRDILFINEANNRVTYEDFDNLYQRTHMVSYLDFNPRSEFWVHDTVMPNFNHAFIKSTFRDNPYLPESELDKILAKYGKSGFENWWRVYGEGEIGILEGQIFDYTIGEFDPSLPFGYGLDFGYNPDPDALVRVAVDERRKKIYLEEKIYQTGQSSGDLKRAVIREIPDLRSLIIADCADPRMIRELGSKGNGITGAALNIYPVKKDGTVSEWLKVMQEYEIIVTEESYNLQKELNNYVWSDKKAGIPVDAFNHLIDAGRYYFMFQKQKTPTFFL